MTRVGSAQELEPRRPPLVLLIVIAVLVVTLVLGGIWWFGRGPTSPSGGQ